MKKMMFNDRFGLTEAVLQGRKTVTRRTIIAPNWACDVTIGHDGAPIASDGDECADIQLNAVWLDKSEIIGNIHDNQELLKTE